MLQINPYIAGVYTFTKDPFFIATTVASAYTPLIAVPKIVHINSDFHFFTYHKPLINVLHMDTFEYSEILLYECLNAAHDLKIMSLEGNTAKGIIIGKGCIYDNQNNLLLMLSCEAGADIEYQERRSSTISKEQGKNMKLFLSTKLLMNDIYAKLYVNLQKNYIFPACEIEIPVEIMSSEKINSLHYANDFHLKFENHVDLETHLINFVPKILGMCYDSFQTIPFCVIPEGPFLGNNGWNTPDSIPIIEEDFSTPETCPF